MEVPSTWCRSGYCLIAVSVRSVHHWDSALEDASLHLCELGITAAHNLRCTHHCVLVGQGGSSLSIRHQRSINLSIIAPHNTQPSHVGPRAQGQSPWVLGATGEDPTASEEGPRVVSGVVSRVVSRGSKVRNSVFRSAWLIREAPSTWYRVGTRYRTPPKE